MKIGTCLDKKRIPDKEIWASHKIILNVVQVGALFTMHLGTGVLLAKKTHPEVADDADYELQRRQRLLEQELPDAPSELLIQELVHCAVQRKEQAKRKKQSKASKNAKNKALLALASPIAPLERS